MKPSSRPSSPRRRRAPIPMPMRLARRCAGATSACCSATASGWRSGSTAPTRRIAASSSAARSRKAGISARGSALRSSAATTPCAWRSTGRCSGYGSRAASPICGCGIFRSARSDHERRVCPLTGTSMSQAEIKTPSLRETAERSSAWPFEEARKIVARLQKHPKDTVVFETGYGPSGLPHIGTFGEVARTSMVRRAFRVLTGDAVKTRLIAFSDDMDGLRKMPDNVPNRDMLETHLGKPLTRIPDPFGTHPSFGEHNNARLRVFLDQFGFAYEFYSASECYASGRFDATLLRVLERYEQVMAIMLPSLREERAQTYSPFLPVSPRTGAVLQVPVLAHHPARGTITYEGPAPW